MHYGLDGRRLGVRVAANEAERIVKHVSAGPDGAPVLSLPEEHVERYRDHGAAYAFRVIDPDGVEIAGMNQAVHGAAARSGNGPGPVLACRPDRMAKPACWSSASTG